MNKRVFVVWNLYVHYKKTYLRRMDGQQMVNQMYFFKAISYYWVIVRNLQPSVTYWFYVTAKNSQGSSTSEVTSCKTVEETTSSQTGVVAGSVGGALVLVTIVLILGIFAHRRYTCIIAFEERNRDKKVNTEKDASNYTTIKETCTTT